MSKLCAGDQVVAIAGNDRGKQGKVLAVKGSKIVVEGLNVRKKHMKPTQENPKGQILEIERPFNVSNVAPCDSEGKRIKIGIRIEGSRKELVDRKGNVFRTIRKGKE